MKYELQTIPVWDALRKGSECPICTLMEAAEADSVNFYLGSSVMNPETRVQANTIGFCPHHMDLLAQARKPQSLAVMLRSVIDEQASRLAKPFAMAVSARPGHSCDKAVSAITDAIASEEKGCLICRRMEARLVRYCYTVAVLWATDEEFRKTLESSRGFCLHHFARILQISSEALPARDRVQFVRSMTELESRGLKAVSSDVQWMTQMYKSENEGASWNGCEDAQIRAAYKLIGKARIQDESDK